MFTSKRSIPPPQDSLPGEACLLHKIHLLEEQASSITFTSRRSKAFSTILTSKKNKLSPHTPPPAEQSVLQELFTHGGVRSPLGRELKCCYKATLDGFSTTAFHNCSDFKGPCVIIGWTNNSFKFGAFNPEGYRSTDDYYETFDAFLFYWGKNDQTTDEPIVLPKVGGSGAALFDYARGGLQFGADGLLIGPPLAPVMGGFAGPDTNSGIGDLRQAKSRLGLSYAKRPDGKESLFGDELKAVLAEVEVFCSPQIASLY
ncbi:hypothetical protein RHMOL_Rhmol11G0038100 [Rhododendron molle]|uniref:Uncharacterized protein n=1 Tax=Rhododendron molle TaxID=49168 RepID=A0ACC0LNJ9_RHOML|nr:hypothetical protein RHMOL_Rhmol11G0038100 [Rhododendron molle]